MRLSSRFGKVLDGAVIDRKAFAQYDGRFPVLLSNVFPVGHTKLLEKVFAFLKTQKLHFERRYDGKKHEDMPHFEDQYLSLDLFNRVLEKANHSKSVLLHDEKILNKCNFQNDFQLPFHLFGINYFDYFPSRMRSSSALYFGSVGYRSMLHCDPYQWSGTNYLLKGKKLWTFLPSSAGLMNIQAHAVKHEDAYKTLYCSTRVDSRTDLYRSIVAPRLGEFAASEAAAAAAQKIDIETETWMASLRDNRNEEEAMMERVSQVPVFRGNRVSFDALNDSRYNKAVTDGAYYLVQEPGEMVIIPPGYFHQVYYLEESVAIASQYCNVSSKDKIFEHMKAFAIQDKFQLASSVPREEYEVDVDPETYEWASISKESSPLLLQQQAQDEVKRLFQQICDEKYGPHMSSFHYNKLFGEVM